MFRQSTNQKSLHGFLVVTSLDGINGPSIQTLLRGENDSKQSDEIQAMGIMNKWFVYSVVLNQSIWQYVKQCRTVLRP